MNQELWTAVDRYFTDLLIPSDPVLEAALDASDGAGLPAIAVTPNQGKLLMLIAQMIGARKILEIGTLGGYSTIWLARGLPSGGRLITLEADAKHAKVARANIDRAGLSGTVEIRVGKALDTLPALVENAPFDLMFIDADKENNPRYLEWSMRLAKPGSVIIVDNVVRRGNVVDEKSADPNVVGTRRAIEMLAKEPRLSATAIQTVGSKGWDGFAIARMIS